MRCDGRAQDVIGNEGKRAKIKRHVIMRQGSPSVDSNYRLQAEKDVFFGDTHAREAAEVASEMKLPRLLSRRATTIDKIFFLCLASVAFFVSELPGYSTTHWQNAWQIWRLK